MPPLCFCKLLERDLKKQKKTRVPNVTKWSRIFLSYYAAVIAIPIAISSQNICICKVRKRCYFLTGTTNGDICRIDLKLVAECHIFASSEKGICLFFVVVM